MIRATVYALALLLSACSLPDGVPDKVVLDTLCVTAQRKLWSANDAPETIRDAKEWNRRIDRRCGFAATVASR